MRKINLLYVSSSLESIHEYRFLKFISADRGINLIVVTCEPKSIHENILGLGIKIIKSPEADFNIDLPIFRRISLEYRHFKFVSFISNIIQKYNIDIIHSGWLTLDSYDTLKTGFHPVLAMSWGSDVLNDPYMENPHTSRWFRRKLKYVAENADAIYCDASIVAESIVKLTGINSSKINVFPQLGIDVSVFKPDITLRNKMRNELNIADYKVLIMTRNFSPVYGIDIFIKSIPAVLEEVPNLYIILVGSGQQYDYLNNICHNINIQDNVKFMGTVPNGSLPNILNAADMYISTSHSDGTSLSLLEAMSCGLPVVISDIPSALEWIRDDINGYIVKRNDIQDTSRGIIDLLKNPDKMTLFGRRNRAVALDKIDIYKNYDKLSSIYRNLVGVH